MSTKSNREGMNLQSLKSQNIFCEKNETNFYHDGLLLMVIITRRNILMRLRLREEEMLRLRLRPLSCGLFIVEATSLEYKHVVVCKP
jgi:hypothetical protein